MADLSSDWQFENETLSQRTKYVLDNKKEWSDCSFLLGECEKEIYAHKIFLAMSSSVFETMFYGSLPEKEFPIRIPDIEPADFQLLLQYIYTGCITLDSLDKACSVYYAARKYMIFRLMKLCINKVWDFLSHETTCCIYEFATSIEDKELEAQCLKIISVDTAAVLEDPSFLRSKSTTLETILDMDDLSVRSEVELFKALLRWAESECQRKAAEGVSFTLRSVVSTTLPKVRFLTLKPEEMAEEIEDSDLLEESEKYKILINILSDSESSTNKRKRKVPMPDDFSINRTLRRGCEVSDQNHKYTWIQVDPEKQEIKGKFSITNIPLKVNKRMKIMGVQVNSEWYTTFGTNNSSVFGANNASGFGANVSGFDANVSVFGCNNTSLFGSSATNEHINFKMMVVELLTDGKPVSACYIREVIRKNEYIAMSGLDYLERNQNHSLKITTFFQTFAQIRNSLQFGSGSVYSSSAPGEALPVEFPADTSLYNVNNLPIKTIVYQL